MKSLLNDQKGYIALISSIIIAAILMTVVFSLGYTSFTARFNILDSEYKERSYDLAKACMDIALLKLINEPSSYTGNESIIFNGEACSILDITSSGGQYTLKSKASVSKAFTSLKMTISSGTFSVISLEEVTNF